MLSNFLTFFLPPPRSFPTHIFSFLLQCLRLRKNLWSSATSFTVSLFPLLCLTSFTSSLPFYQLFHALPLPPSLPSSLPPILLSLSFFSLTDFRDVFSISWQKNFEFNERVFAACDNGNETVQGKLANWIQLLLIQ